MVKQRLSTGLDDPVYTARINFRLTKRHKRWQLLKELYLKGKNPGDCQDEINKIIKTFRSTLGYIDLQVQVYRTVASFKMLYDKGKFPT